MNVWSLRAADRFKCQRGFTMIELLIALLLGSVFTLAIIEVYLFSKRQFAVEQAMVELRQNGQFAMRLLLGEIRYSGFLGGVGRGVDVPAIAISRDCVSPGNWVLDVALSLELIGGGTYSTDQPPRTSAGIEMTCLSPTQIVPATDLLAVKRTAGQFTVRNGFLSERIPVRDRQWYLRVAQYGEEVSWYYHGGGELPAGDIQAGSGVAYWEYYANLFYVRSFSEHVDDGIPTLCSEALAGGQTRGVMTTRCLVEGIEDFQVELGIDQDMDGVPNRYVSSPSKADLQSVVSARVSLLVRSIGRVPGGRKVRTFWLGGRKITRSDGFLRRVLESSVQLRNPDQGLL